MNYKINGYLVCGLGKIRQNNEDNYYFNGVHKIKDALSSNGVFETTVKNNGLFGVFDGMGGEDDGELASYIATTTLGKFSKDKLFLNNEEILNFYNSANKRIVEESKKRNLNLCGTTAVTLSFDNNNVYISNIGDSKCFLIRNNEISQISVDHTDALFLQEQGVKNRKPKLTQCLGIDEEYMTIEPYTNIMEIQDKDIFVACSDGITDMVSEEYLLETLKSGCDADKINEIESKVLENGGKDNYTLLVVSVSNNGQITENTNNKIENLSTKKIKRNKKGKKKIIILSILVIIVAAVFGVYKFKNNSIQPAKIQQDEYVVGYNLFKNEDYESAIEYFEAGIEKDPENYDDYASLLMAYLLNGNENNFTSTLLKLVETKGKESYMPIGGDAQTIYYIKNDSYLNVYIYNEIGVKAHIKIDSSDNSTEFEIYDFVYNSKNGKYTQNELISYQNGEYCLYKYNVNHELYMKYYYKDGKFDHIENVEN